MDTPNLSGVKLHYSGPILGKTVFVREVVGFSNLPPVDGKIWLSHPTKKESVSSEAPRKEGGKVSLPTPVNIHIDEHEEDTGTGRNNRFVDVRAVTFDFIAEPVTELLYSSSKISPKGNKENLSLFETPETLIGGLGDPSQGSDLKPVEYGHLRCSIQDKTGGLRLFADVAKWIAKANGWKLSMLYFELPNVTRSNFRLLENRPRQAGFATFTLPNGLTKHLLEVQISDGRYLSTLLLSPSKPVGLETCYKKVELLLWAVVKGGGQWKEEVLRPLKRTLEPFIIQKIRHPRNLHEKRRAEALNIWVRKFISVFDLHTL